MLIFLPFAAVVAPSISPFAATPISLLLFALLHPINLFISLLLSLDFYLSTSISSSFNPLSWLSLSHLFSVLCRVVWGAALWKTDALSSRVTDRIWWSGVGGREKQLLYVSTSTQLNHAGKLMLWIATWISSENPFKLYSKVISRIDWHCITCLIWAFCSHQPSSLALLTVCSHHSSLISPEPC